MTSDRIAIFVDFDGVLHPHPCERHQLFEGVPMLSDALGMYLHEIEILISSAWRLDASLDELKQRFPPEIQHIMIDVTPNFRSLKKEELIATQAWPDERTNFRYQRQREIELWLQMNRPDGVPWIAIDDWADDFESNHQDLLLTNHETGLTALNIRTLHLMIRLRKQGL